MGFQKRGICIFAPHHCGQGDEEFSWLRSAIILLDATESHSVHKPLVMLCVCHFNPDVVDLEHTISASRINAYSCMADQAL